MGKRCRSVSFRHVHTPSARASSARLARRIRRRRPTSSRAPRARDGLDGVDGLARDASPRGARRSRWAFPAILVHFAAAKSAWVLSTFLPYYDGGAIGAWLTVVQVVAIALIFRSTDQSWFRPRP